MSKNQRQGQQSKIPWWESVVGHPTRVKRQIKQFLGIWESLTVPTPCSSRGVQLLSAENATQQRDSNPGSL